MESARNAAREAAIAEIESHESYEPCEPQKVYHDTLSRLLKPLAEQSRGKAPSQALSLYDEGIITHYEFLCMLVGVIE